MCSRFYSNWDIVGGGFQIQYDSHSSPCGNDINLVGPKGYLTSLRHPFHYFDNSDCVYTISVQKGTFIKITFMSFQIEWDSECKKDFLEIIDTNYQESPLPWKFCGNISDVPDTIQSSGNYVQIR